MTPTANASKGAQFFYEIEGERVHVCMFIWGKYSGDLSFSLEDWPKVLKMWPEVEFIEDAESLAAADAASPTHTRSWIDPDCLCGHDLEHHQTGFDKTGIRTGACWAGDCSCASYEYEW